MSTLGDALVEALGRRKMAVAKDRVEKILTDASVSSTASTGVPVQLRVRRVHVTGTRAFQAAEGDDAITVTAPIELDWTPLDGVNGIGSEQNLRGKSSVVHFAMWALTGRSQLQADVASWVDHVSAELSVDGVSLVVDFDVDKGVPSGSAVVRTGERRTEIGHFTSHDEFESLMGSVMLGRLRLEAISLFSADGESSVHSWPTYASSLTVRADQLDPILGPENTLKTRILQMFVGTSWASMDAQITRALNALKYERDRQDRVHMTMGLVPGTALGDAEDRVAGAKASVAEFNPAEPDLDAVYELAVIASERGRDARELELQLMTVDATFSQARTQLRIEERRQRAIEETAVAQALFNGMKPTACPRCATEVTADRYEAEMTEHHCSLCASTLHFEVAAATTTSAAAHHYAEPECDDEQEGDDVEVPQDPLVALTEAVEEATAAVATIREFYRLADEARAAAAAEADAAQATLVRARARTAANQELIAAQAARDALQALSRQVGPDGGGRPGKPDDEAAERDEKILVLDAALTLVKQWVKRDQDPMLAKVSAAITDIARRFGVSNLESVTLKGNANMDIVKGGARTTYSGLTNGEKLRIKLATAIALVQVGHNDHIGRHPGLLFIDSPAAEEIPETVLRTMLQAMTEVAEEIELQIVVATTHATILSDVLDEAHLLVATGDDYVW